MTAQRAQKVESVTKVAPAPKGKVLLVGTEQHDDFRWIKTLLASQGYDVIEVKGERDAIDALDRISRETALWHGIVIPSVSLPTCRHDQLEDRSRSAIKKNPLKTGYRLCQRANDRGLTRAMPVILLYEDDEMRHPARANARLTGSKPFFLGDARSPLKQIFS